MVNSGVVPEPDGLQGRETAPLSPRRDWLSVFAIAIANAEWHPSLAPGYAECFPKSCPVCGSDHPDHAAAVARVVAQFSEPNGQRFSR